MILSSGCVVALLRTAGSEPLECIAFARYPETIAD